MVNKNLFHLKLFALLISLILPYAINMPISSDCYAKSSSGSINCSITISAVGSVWARDSNVNNSDHISIEDLTDPLGGQDIQLEVHHPPSSNFNIYALVHDQSSNGWWRYGPATEKEPGIWIVAGVRFGEGPHQGRSFTIRGVVERGTLQTYLDDLKWVDQAAAISEPIYMEVKKRELVREDSANSDNPTLWISTINGKTISPGTPFLAPNVVTVAGTMHDNNSSALSNNIYLIVCYSSSRKWRAFGPAFKQGNQWEISSIDIGDPSTTDAAEATIITVLSKNKLVSGQINYDTIFQNTISRSASCAITIDARNAYSKVEHARVTFDNFQFTNKNIENVRNKTTLFVDSLNEIVAFNGSVSNLPQGANVCVLLNPGTQFWWVLGNASIDNDAWMQGFSYNEELDHLSFNVIRLVAIITLEKFDKPLLSYNDWRENAIYCSPIKAIKIGTETNISGTTIEYPIAKPNDMRHDLRIESISGRKVRLKNQITLNRNTILAIKGIANHLLPHSQIWIGIKSSNMPEWEITGPIFVDKTSWQSMYSFPDSSINDNSNSSYKIMQAFSSKWNMPKKVTDIELSWYSYVSSNIVYISNSNCHNFAKGLPKKEVTMSIIFWVILITVLFILLSILEYWLRMVSNIFKEIANLFSGAAKYLSNQFEPIPKPSMRNTTLSLFLLIIGLFAIINYFPIYTHVIQTALNLTEEKSKSLATLLICFIGLSGIILHLAIDAKVIWMVLAVGTVTPMFWIAQALLYFKMYSLQSQQDQLIPSSMLAMSFFLAGIETLVFYWVTNLGQSAFSWGLYNIPYIAIRFCQKLCIIISNVMETIPSKYANFKGNIKTDINP